MWLNINSGGFVYSAKLHLADSKILTEVSKGRKAYVFRIKHSWNMRDMRLLTREFQRIQVFLGMTLCYWVSLPTFRRTSVCSPTTVKESNRNFSCDASIILL